jgi:hypothetical protein
MASATYLQSLDATYEDGTSRGVTPSNRRQIETFIASDAKATPIAIGDVVCFKFAHGNDPGTATLHAAKAPAGKHCMGVALSAADEDNQEIEVCISGVCEAAVSGTKTGGGNQVIASGDYISLSSVPADAGKYYFYTAGTDACPDAILIDGVGGGASGVVTVIVLKKF